MRKQSGQVHSRESSATLQLTVSLLYRDYCFDMGGNMMMDSDGNLMQDIGGGVAMDMESGEMHIVESNSSFGSSFDDED